MATGTLRQEGEATRRGIKCAFASTAAKRRATNERLLPHLRWRDQILRGSETDRPEREDSVGYDDFEHRHVSTAPTVRGGRICPDLVPQQRLSWGDDGDPA